MSDRYAVPFQAFITNGAVITSDVTGRVATAGNTTLTLSTTGGAGTFTITLGSGCTGTITSGTATITDSPKALAAGANTITSNGAGNCTLNLTLGTAANWNTVNTWSATSGGVSGASIPTSSDNVYHNANSYTAGSQVLTVDAAAHCKDLDFTGATNNPILSIATAQALRIYGNVTFIAAMAVSSVVFGYLSFLGAGAQAVTTNGITLQNTVLIHVATNTVTLNDAITVTQQLCNQGGTVDTNGKTVTCYEFWNNGAIGANTFILGASTINCRKFSVTAGTPTVTAGTSTINCSGDFAGNGKTYNIVNLTGATSTVSGNNTFATLALPSGTTQTITFTDGTTQSATTFTLSGSAGHVHTLAGTGGAGWTLFKVGGGTVTADYLHLTNSNAT